MNPLNVLITKFNLFQQWTGNQSGIGTGLDGLSLGSENSLFSDLLQWLSRPGKANHFPVRVPQDY